MRICRFDDARLGLVTGDTVIDVTEALAALPDLRWPLPAGDQLVTDLEALRGEIEKAARTGETVRLTDIGLLNPIPNLQKLFGIGINYRDHAEEAQQDQGIAHGRTYSAEEEDVRFSPRCAGAVVGPSEGVALRFLDQRNDHEVELGVVIGKAGTEIPRGAALDHVAGYCIGLDMTMRGAGDASARKAIDSYLVLGPWLVTKEEIPDPDKLEISMVVNGEERQRSNTALCRFKTAEIIEAVSRFCTLYPGDVIMTGTPGGVTPVKPGDVMVAEIEDIGRMTVAVRAH